MNSNEKIVVEQARLLHGLWALAAIGLYLAAILICWILRDEELTLLPHWFLLSTINTIYQLHYCWRFRKSKAEASGAKRFLSWSIINALIAGFVWAFAIIFFLPYISVSGQYTLIFTLTLLSATSWSTSGAYYPGFISFFGSFNVPLMLVIGLGMTPLHPAAAILAFFAITYICILGYYFRNVFFESLRLRFENVDLVDELLIQKESAESASKSKSRFLAAASHDLRQPMHALTLYLGSLSSLDLPSAALPYLDRSRKCADTLDEMFEALLDISKFDADVVTTDIRTFSLSELLENVQIEYAEIARLKSIEFTVIPCSATVRSDEKLVGRVLRNLASNAMRYTDQGSILIGCRRKESEIHLHVIDTGKGIPLDQQSLIFEEFHQLDNPERDRNRGLGLGLAIVQRITRLLNLPLNLTSKPGVGTHLTLVLPRNDVDVQHQQTMNSKDKVNSLAGALVVVIDDEVEILRATGDLLRLWGCDVITAEGSKEALDRLSTSTKVPDLVICDYRLRGKENGIDAIADIRDEFNSNIPALLITGDTGPEPMRDLVASKIKILHKPIQLDILRQQVTALYKQQ